MSDPRILFVHVPKTAGMSLYYALAKAVGEARAIRFPDGSKLTRERWLAMPDEEARRYRLISGHLPLNVFMSKRLEDYTTVTVLRNPVDRELSAYFYVKTWEQHPRHEAVKKMDLYEYLEEREAKPGGRNTQCRMIGGAPSFEAARRALDERYALAAPVEYLDEFAAELTRRLSIPQLNVKRSNITSFRVSAREIHPDIIRRFEKITRGDLELYRYAKAKFEREVLSGRVAHG